MKRASIAATVYLLALFALGFILGTIRVLLFVAPRIEVLGATLDEVPLMLTAAFFISRWQLAAGWCCIPFRRAGRWRCGYFCY